MIQFVERLIQMGAHNLEPVIDYTDMGKRRCSSKKIKVMKVVESSTVEEEIPDCKIGNYSDVHLNLLRVLDSNYSQMDVLVPSSPVFQHLEGKLIGEINLLMGPSQSGKTSAVYWALLSEPKETVQIVIDCSMVRTDMEFIQRFTTKLGEVINLSFIDKNIVVKESIDFQELGNIIMCHKKKFVFVFKHAQILAGFKKQLILYNLFEWMKTDVSQKVGMVLISHSIRFLDRLEKRVRSRMTAKSHVILKPSGNKILEILERRVEHLIDSESRQHRFCVRPSTRNNKSRIPCQLWQQNKAVYMSLRHILGTNKKLRQLIEKQQSTCAKGAIYYLNSFKMMLLRIPPTGLVTMSETKLANTVIQLLGQEYERGFPLLSINKDLLANLNCPDWILMAMIYYMCTNKIYPMKLKEIFKLYNSRVWGVINTYSVGSSFLFSRSVYEQSIQRLNIAKIIRLEDAFDLWNGEFVLNVSPETIIKALKEAEGMPGFIFQICDHE